MKAGLARRGDTRTQGDFNMELITAELRERLLANRRTNAARIAANGNTIDFPPVVKLFTPDANCTWLLSEIDPEEPDIAFGLCDLGMGSPERARANDWNLFWQVQNRHRISQIFTA
jgi:hypothetical protein